jgi:hypothetical protein
MQDTSASKQWPHPTNINRRSAYHEACSAIDTQVHVMMCQGSLNATTQLPVTPTAQTLVSLKRACHRCMQPIGGVVKHVLLRMFQTRHQSCFLTNVFDCYYSNCPVVSPVIGHLLLERSTDSSVTAQLNSVFSPHTAWAQGPCVQRHNFLGSPELSFAHGGRHNPERPTSKRVIRQDDPKSKHGWWHGRHILC